MLTLYHAEPVANSMKVLLCLKEKGLEFESRYVDLFKFEQHSSRFIAINPNGQVPALVHDGRVVTESTVINEYLEDLFPEVPLRPADPWERAQMRIWGKHIDEYYNPAVSMLGWHTMVRKIAQSIEKDEFEKLLARIPLKEQRDKWATIAGDSFTPEQLAESERKISVSLQKMETALQNQPWLAGHTYSLADVNIYSLVSSGPRLTPQLQNDGETPRVLDWLARMNARPAVQAALAMPNKAPEKLRAFG